MTESDADNVMLFDKYLSVRQAAARLSVNPGTIRNWVSSGELVPDGRIGNQLRFLVAVAREPRPQALELLRFAAEDDGAEREGVAARGTTVRLDELGEVGRDEVGEPVVAPLLAHQRSQASPEIQLALTPRLCGETAQPSSGAAGLAAGARERVRVGSGRVAGGDVGVGRLRGAAG